MAKDKTKEVQYKVVRLQRQTIRKLVRSNKYREHSENKTSRGNGRCSLCGGQMTWCSCCDMWSSYCCEEYGTCMCS